ncbi:MAG TPA: PRTRC system ThiF family protein [Bacteroidia bacterium]|nr:PRTRC system ThiF family protein [Bacteroidia bacterium]
MRKSVSKKSVSKKEEKKVHFTEQYFLSPEHPITVKVIGCGGSGSQMLQALARINVSLIALGHPGIVVQAWDPDKVSEANLGRQLFSKADLDQYKAKILIERINRFYGFNWQSFPMKWDQQALKDRCFANMMVSCVDNVQSREWIEEIKYLTNNDRSPFNIPVYWLDLGNSQTSGQVVLGTFGKVNQPKGSKGTVKELPTILDLFPDMKKFDKPDMPSCSLAEALGKQDLFINSILAQYGAQLIWKMFRNLKLEYHGLFLNLDNLSTNPIMIKAKNEKA